MAQSTLRRRIAAVAGPVFGLLGFLTIASSWEPAARALRARGLAAVALALCLVLVWYGWSDRPPGEQK